MATRRYALITFDLDDTLWDVGTVLARAEQRVEQWMRDALPARAATLRPRGADGTAPAALPRPPRAAPPHQRAAHRGHASRAARGRPRRGLGAAARRAGIRGVHGRPARHRTVRRRSTPCSPQLARRYVLGALTNGNADVFRLPLGRHFRFAFNAETLGASKPAAGALRGRAARGRRAARAGAARRRSPRARRAGRAPGRHDRGLVQSRGSRP